MSVSHISDEQIGDLFADGILTPTMFGLDWVEVRYPGTCHSSKSSPCQHDENTRNDWVARYVTPIGNQRIDYIDVNDPAACPNMWRTNEDGPKGIAAGYTGGGTVSYLSDDRELLGRIHEAIRSLMCLTCGHQTWPQHTDTAHQPSWRVE